MNLACLFVGHVWFIEKTEVDPVPKRCVFSNFVYEIYNMQCLRSDCIAKDKVKKIRDIPEGTKEYNDRVKIAHQLMKNQ